MRCMNLFMFVAGFLLNYCIERRTHEYNTLKELLQMWLISASYNCIYVYSKCQIWCIRNVVTREPFVTLMKLCDQMFRTPPCAQTKVLYVKDHQYYMAFLDAPDFVVVCDCAHIPEARKIVYAPNCGNDASSFELSSVKFMLVEFLVGEKTYKIDLLTDVYNYCVVGNIFNLDFFVYFINAHCLDKGEQHSVDPHEQYVLRLIDHDVNKLVVDFTDKREHIELGQNDYQVKIVTHVDK